MCGHFAGAMLYSLIYISCFGKVIGYIYHPFLVNDPLGGHASLLEVSLRCQRDFFPTYIIRPCIEISPAGKRAINVHIERPAMLGPVIYINKKRKTSNL